MCTMGPSILLSEFLHLNDCAVALLAQGETSKSTRVLHIALRDFKSSLPGMTPLPATRKDIQPVTLQESQPNYDHHASSPNNAFAIFNRAFVMDSSCTDPDEAAAMVLFNFALSIHTQGLKEGKSAYLYKALHTYNLISTMVQATARSFQEHSGWKLLQLALWNNMGYIHSYFLNIAGVRDSVDRIHALLADRHNTVDVSMEDLAFFHTAVFHIDIGRFEHPAAAA